MMTMDHGLLLLFHVSLLRLSFLCWYFKRMILYFHPCDEDGALLIFLHQTKFFCTSAARAIVPKNDCRKRRRHERCSCRLLLVYLT